ncbi:unnamed protein product [Cyprideis torosa]|uniref:Uncharacterized protein n=1 Tax=Cyprideis torosa TaxID=163714 RepID=A0A7R8W8A3_9CRUS|nr:unnamed protein product [Cyprideis torosa]CAG0888382.1 unnamed protein product [Cyprideis torosa]
MNETGVGDGDERLNVLKIHPLEENGLMNLSGTTSSVAFHEKLNVVLSTVKEDENVGIRVLDVNSGSLMRLGREGDLPYGFEETGGLQYLPECNKLFTWQKNVVGLRSDHQGILLLDTILQPPVLDKDVVEVVRVELILQEVALLLAKRLNSITLPPGHSEYQADVEAELKRKNQTVPANWEKKWATVVLELPFVTLHDVCNSLLQYYSRKKKNIAVIPILSGIAERLNNLGSLNGSDSIFRGSMNSETNRRLSFEKWPHTDFKWANPDHMAQAGFYHEPADSGEDRVVCFACHCCLVNWEPSDEPWSEHERHSSSCPHVKGEFTQNVPRSLIDSTGPASFHRVDDIPAVIHSSSPNTHPELMATATITGDIVIWNVERQLRREQSLQVQLSSINASLLGRSGQRSMAIVDQETGEQKSDTPEPRPMKSGSDFRVTSVCILHSRDVVSSTSMDEGTVPTNSSLVVGVQIRSDEEDREANESTESNEIWVPYLLVYELGTRSPSKETRKRSTEKKVRHSRRVKKKFPAVFATEEWLAEEYQTFTKTKAQKTGTSSGTQSVAPSFGPTSTPFSCPSNPALDNSSIAEQEQEHCYPPPVLTDCIPLHRPGDREPLEGLRVSHLLPCDGQLIVTMEFQEGKWKSSPIAGQPSSFDHVGAISVHKLCSKKTNSVHVSIVEDPTSFDNLIHEIDLISCITKLPPEFSVDVSVDEVGRHRSYVAMGTRGGLGRIVSTSPSSGLVGLREPPMELNSTDPYLLNIFYCATVERLCLATRDGSLHFFSVRRDSVPAVGGETSVLSVEAEEMEVDFVDGAPTPEYQNRHLHAPYPIDAPPHWIALVQAQRQRRAPQTLTSMLENSQSFTLMADRPSGRPGGTPNGSPDFGRSDWAFRWAFIMVRNVAHVDFRFTFSKAVPTSELPDLEVSLYSQRLEPSLQEEQEESLEKEAPEKKKRRFKNLEDRSATLRPEAKLLVGPIPLAPFMDLSGRGGLVPLMSRELLQNRAKCFLIVVNDPQLEANADQYETEESPVSSAEPMKSDDGLNSILRTRKISRAGIRLPLRPKPGSFLSNAWGCRALEEVTFTVRVFKTFIEGDLPRDQEVDMARRVDMLTSRVFQENLVQRAIEPDVSLEERIHIMDVLTWIVATHGTCRNSSTQPHQIVSIISRHLDQIVRFGMIFGNRSVAHKTARLLSTCTFSPLAEQQNNGDIIHTFKKSLLHQLLGNLSLAVNSDFAGALHWYITLIHSVREMNPNQTFKAVLEILHCVSQKLEQRENPYHGLLQARLGLDGMPFEEEIFDIRSNLLPYPESPLTVTSRTAMQLREERQSAFRDEDPVVDGDILHWISINQLKSPGYLLPYGDRNVYLGGHIHLGLMEVEPLSFVLCRASQGAKLEPMSAFPQEAYRSEDGFRTPVVFSSTVFSGIGSGGGAKKDMSSQGTFAHSTPKSGLHTWLDQWSENGPGNGGSGSKKPMKRSLTQGPSSSGTGSQLDRLSAGASGSACPSTSSDSHPAKTRKVDDKKASSSYYGSQPSGALLVQKFLRPPSDYVLEVTSLESGAKRFALLDFGEAVHITDIIIPPCRELLSLCVDAWIDREDVDRGSRIVITEDIAQRPVVLTDLQPPVHCRYVKISIIAKHGISSSRARIPVGTYWGHLASAPWTEGGMRPSKSLLDSFKALLEDVTYRYSMSTTRLRSLLEPLLDSSGPSLSHQVAAKIPAFRYKNEQFFTTTEKQVEENYLDCLALREQKNIIQQIIKRFRKSMGKGPVLPSWAFEEPRPDLLTAAIGRASTDKLRVISELLLSVLTGLLPFCAPNPALSTLQLVTCYPDALTVGLCSDLFVRYCVRGSRHEQATITIFLLTFASKQPWWPEFISSALVRLFSSQPGTTCAQDRLFAFLLFLGQRSPNPTAIIRHTLLKLSEKLPVSQRQDQDGALLTGAIDLPLVTWILFYLSAMLRAFPLKSGNKADADRWKFLTGCSLMLSKNKSPIRRRLASRRPFHAWPTATHSKSDIHPSVIMDTVGPAGIHPAVIMDTVGPPGTVETDDAVDALNVILPQNTSSLSEEKFVNKFHDALSQILAKKYEKNVSDAPGPYGGPVLLGSSLPFLSTSMVDPPICVMEKMRAATNSSKTNKPPLETNSISYVVPPFKLKRAECLVFAKNLASFIVSLDVACTSDVFVIGCQVLSRVTSCTTPSIRLAEIFSPEQIHRLLRRTVGVPGVAWEVHSVTALLLDILGGEYRVRQEEETVPTIREEFASEAATSTEAATSSETASAPKPKKPAADSPSSPAPKLDDFEVWTAESLSLSDEELENPDLTTWMSADEALLKTPPMSPPGSHSLAKFVCDEAGNDVFTLDQVQAMLYPHDVATSSAGKTLKKLLKTSANYWTLDDQKFFQNGSIDSDDEGFGASANTSTGPNGSGNTSAKTTKACLDPFFLSKSIHLRTGPCRFLEKERKLTTVKERADILSHTIDPRLECQASSVAELRLHGIASSTLVVQNFVLPSATPSRGAEGDATETPDEEDQESINRESLILMTKVFEKIFTSQEEEMTDEVVVHFLELWLKLNCSFHAARTSRFSSVSPLIQLTIDSASALLSVFASSTKVTPVDWGLLWLCLCMSCNENGMGSRMSLSRHFGPAILQFLKCTLYDPGTAKSSTMVGPNVSGAFDAFLNRVQSSLYTLNADGERKFIEAMLKTINSIFAGGVRSLGPLDSLNVFLCHAAFLQFGRINQYSLLDTVDILCAFVRGALVDGDQSFMRGGSRVAEDLRTDKSKDRSTSPLTVGSIQDVICVVIHLIKKLMNVPVLSPETAGSSQGETVIEENRLSSQTDASRARRNQESTTDEDKASSVPFRCSHHKDEASYPKLVDLVLSHKRGMSYLLDCLLVSPCATRENLPGEISVPEDVSSLASWINRNASDFKVVVSQLYQFLFCHRQYVLHLSDLLYPSKLFVEFVKEVLDCPNAIAHFHSLGGLTQAASLLIRACAHASSPAPSVVTALMGYCLGRGVTPQPQTSPWDPSYTIRGRKLMNISPMSKVEVNGEAVEHAKNLCLETPYKRGTRAYTWSHTFQNQDAYVELTITLPFASLVHQVEVIPHTSSANIGPSLAQLEIATEQQGPFFPVTVPVPSHGSSAIILPLVTPRIVQTIRLRLFRSTETTCIALQQVKVMGEALFTDGVVPYQPDRSPTNACISWLQVLERCFEVAESSSTVRIPLEQSITDALVDVAGLIPACVSLLSSSSQQVEENKAASVSRILVVKELRVSAGYVLRKLGEHCEHSSLVLIEALLNNGRGSSLHGNDGEAVKIGIMYSLLSNKQPSTQARMQFVMNHLDHQASRFLAAAQQGNQDLGGLRMDQWTNGYEDDVSTSPAYIHCLASALWHAKKFFPAEMMDFSTLINVTTFKNFLNWACKLPEGSRLKRALDCLLCAICHTDPSYLTQSVQHMGLCAEDTVNAPDEVKDPTPLPLGPTFYLTPQQFSTLAAMSLSKAAGTRLISSGFLHALAQLIKDQCSNNGKDLNVPLVLSILNFFSDLCEEQVTLAWLAEESSHIFWSPLLTVLADGSRDAYDLSGFTRRLILQVLLEPEKIHVLVTREDEGVGDSMQLPVTTQLRHPRYGVGMNTRIIDVPLEARVGDLHSLLEDHDTDSSLGVPSSRSEDQALSRLGNVQMLSSGNIEFLKKLHSSKVEGCSRTSSAPTTSRSQHKKKKEQKLGLFHKKVSTELTPDLLMGDLVRWLISKKHMDAYSCYVELDQRAPLKDEVTSFSNDMFPLTSCLDSFCYIGGLALLAQHLPLLHPEIPSYDRVSQTEPRSKQALPKGFDADTSEATGGPSENVQLLSMIASDSPTDDLGYAEYILREKTRAREMLRLVLGVKDNGVDGTNILSSPDAHRLPFFPFESLAGLYSSMPLTTDDGVLLRRTTLEFGALHMILGCLGVLAHQNSQLQLPGLYDELVLKATKRSLCVQPSVNSKSSASGGNLPPVVTLKPPPTSNDGDAAQYWAKGTGFGTGSTNQTWDMERSFHQKKLQEQHVTVLLKVLATFICPEEIMDTPALKSFPSYMTEMLQISCLRHTLCSFLRNDSILDMSCHVDVYQAVLECVRALALTPSLHPLLLPGTAYEDDEPYPAESIADLIATLHRTAESYSDRLAKMDSKFVVEGGSEKHLIPDIIKTATMVEKVTEVLREKREAGAGSSTAEPQLELMTVEQRYVKMMKDLRFQFYDMITVQDDTQPDRGRMKRLAQETVTLSSALPLSYSSTVFVRCDTNRLDVMKVLITGPEGTPYSNGCFEFDVYFPSDYPKSPMKVNLETTGRRSVRFNPNLYVDGKVCLSILNTWHGRPEERWNPQTSSLLQVLVSIQSLILVPDPYFNEPGYERTRNSDAGTQASRDYDSNIRVATVRWAMIEQLRNPCPCFKEVINLHFFLKREEILTQVEFWIRETEEFAAGKKPNVACASNARNLRNHYTTLKELLENLTCPPGCEDIAPMEKRPNPPPPLKCESDSGSSSTGVEDELGQSPASKASTSGTGEGEGPLITLEDNSNVNLNYLPSTEDEDDEDLTLPMYDAQNEDNYYL